MRSNVVRAVLLSGLGVSLVFAVAQSPLASPGSSSPDNNKGNAAPATDTPSLKVSTRLVLLDIVALDHKGHPVTDLKAEDFSVEEEGSRQRIRTFSFQQPGQPSNSSAEPTKLPPNLFSNTPTFKSDKTLSVLLMDGLNTDLTNQKYARQEMLKFLEKLPAGQPVAVYALGSKLRLLQDFTTDPSLLKQAIANTKGHTSHALENPTGGQSAPYLSAAVASTMAELGLTAMQQQITFFQQENIAVQTDQRVLLTLAALKSLARTLAGYPGRKNLIWVSSVFPDMIFTNLDPTSAAPHVKASPVLSNYQSEIERLSNALSNARVAVYPVDAGAVINHDVYSSLSNTDSNGNYLGRTATAIGVGGSPLDARGAMGRELDRTPENEMSAHSAMNSVAEQTGGKALYNRNDLDGAIREGMEDGLVYYTLGYYPENKNWNGRFRRVVVKVDRSGITLRHRVGYLALDPKGYSKLDPKQQAMDFGEALSLDYPVATALLFRAAAVAPSEKTGNKLVINFGIDPHTIGFDLKDDGLEYASIDCAAQAFTLKGEPVQVRGNTFNAALKSDAFQTVMQRFFPCNQSLDLGPGDYVLRLGVRDNSSGLIGTANARVTIPPRSAAQSTDDNKR